MNKGIFTITFFLFAFALQAKGINFSGSLYSDFSLLHYHIPGIVDSAKFSGKSVLELKAENNDKKHFKLKADINFYLLYGELAKLYNPLI
ncbi:MAG: hypothetical protein GX640_24545, partial [Fibrobacter sp.]|nr:hypothetical protein [Fibrobacter sp.]